MVLKREESMRRLLEWKQRMLQSPLNRKLQQGNKLTQLKQLDSYHINENDYNIQPQPVNYMRRTGPDSHLNESYSQTVAPPCTSYSSDDEGKHLAFSPSSL